MVMALCPSDSARQLLAELAHLGVHLEAHGDRLRYSPRSAVTPELAALMKQFKGELMASLRPSEATSSVCTDCGTSLIETPTFDGFLNLECLECDRCFGCRPQSDEVAEEFTSRDERVTFVDEGGERIGEVAPCATCGSFELWQTMAGNWRCQKCDPPLVGRRLRKRAEELRRKYAQNNNNVRIDE